MISEKFLTPKALSEYGTSRQLGMRWVVKRTSLKDLAVKLKLTESTVSRALNGYSDISAATAERVRQAAEQFNYKPNLMARRLATGVTEAVAYVIPQNHSAISEPFVAQLLQGLDESLSQRGWDLLVSHSPSAEDEPDMIKKLISSGRVSGVVLSRPFKNDARVKLLQSSGFPFVVHGRSLESDNYAWYDIDNELAFKTAVQHLADLGHRRIGFIGAPLYYNFAQMRLDGYRQALIDNHLPCEQSLIEITELTDDCGERAAADLLDGDDPPSAIICVSDTQAIGALAAIRSRGLTAGREVSVIGYDGIQFGRHTNPPLTTMAQPLAQSGREIGDMLLAIIDGDNPKQHQRLKRAVMLQRKTDGPVWVAPASNVHDISENK